MNHKKPKKPINLPDHPRPQPSPMHTPVGVSFMRVRPGDKHCLSYCERDEVREYVDCLRQLTTMTWQQVLMTGGKPGHKVGLGYTPYEDHDLRGVQRPDWLSQDVSIVGIRASRGMRLFGAYISHVFYVMWFDREHGIVKG